jgi:hypothetical protein
MGARDTLITSTQSTQLHCDGIEAKQLPWSCCKGGLLWQQRQRIVSEVAARVGLLWQQRLRIALEIATYWLVVAVEAKDGLGNCYLWACGGSRG